MTGYQSKKDMSQDKITDQKGRPMTYWGGKAQPAQQNFCPRCGKRTKDIHTCTPQETSLEKI